MKNLDSFHYPPELFDLLIQTIPLLNRSKQSVLIFFRSAGISDELYLDIVHTLSYDKESINKYEICRRILIRINENKDIYIKERRELLKRVVEFETFTNCWESEQYRAKGLVAEIRDIINVKDSFTRIKQEKERIQKKHSDEYTEKVQNIQKRNDKIESIKQQFYSLFTLENPQERGKLLEDVLNSLFLIYGILVREAFTRVGSDGEGIIEQIDGVIELNNQIYLVEMKWKKDKISNNDVFTHLGRIYHRTNAQGIFISASGFTDSAIIAAQEALTGKAVLILTGLDEFIYILENKIDLALYFQEKIRSAIIRLVAM